MATGRVGDFRGTTWGPTRGSGDFGCCRVDGQEVETRWTSCRRMDGQEVETRQQTWEVSPRRLQTLEATPQMLQSLEQKVQKAELQEP